MYEYVVICFKILIFVTIDTTRNGRIELTKRCDLL